MPPDRPARACSFATARLRLRPWRSAGDAALARFLETLLSEPVTRALPASWRGVFPHPRPTEWIAARDAEGALFQVLRGERPVGLLTLYAAPDDPANLRIGYLFAEEAWGQGLASELVAGLIRWARLQPGLVRLVAGVTPDNPASLRVLAKCGFRADARSERRIELSLALR